MKSSPPPIPAARGYVCVYRHISPAPSYRRQTEFAAKGNALLGRFLQAYDAPDSYLDWGDDPSFFAAAELKKTPNAASWGVCRPDVRGRVQPGDFVAFFCVRDESDGRREYFYIGVGTVGALLDREATWNANPSYRRYFNVLARPDDGDLVQHETILPFHDEDWEHRARSPYVVFDPTYSSFNLHTPLQVGSCAGKSADVETWNVSNPRVRELAELVLPKGKGRRLRTTNRGHPHQHMNLAEAAKRVGGLDALRSALIDQVG
jgi:hypothetical protein